MFWKSKQSREKKLDDLIRRQRELEDQVWQMKTFGMRIARLEHFRAIALAQNDCRAGKHEWEVFSEQYTLEKEQDDNERILYGHKHSVPFSDYKKPEDYDDAYLRCKHCHKKKPEGKSK